ncbi:alpha/beta hydrolase [Achromobacter ruhlandii]|uniref:alpha/beta hydrolase n=1 Tax=Achromobacter ruhlandii TaxID=72557 RepID=UPI0006C22FDE|nr:alpha/beta hydrolase [Achromobacter ruhlandii]AMG44870.1 alpha/beta hydrolase [Achromobacter xylosoxidans]CUI28320.1 Phenmedipham hydrolase [Achromobacter ruhlandii]CUI36248.1 Phenmedipham hydrolase [Achromobacter ruhlandii]CUJ95223.1 Phenmedipham hydrolase [Achromobacter ruhlandii]
MSALRLFCLLALLCLPPGLASAVTLTDQRYGPDAAQLADVYLPAAPGAPLAPILVLVHGGSWLQGDKAEPDFIRDKLARWLPLGFVVVSVNTRLLPDAGPREQAGDLGLAVAWAQRQAAAWRADPARILLMGHSSGGHLLALLAADAALRERTGARPWLANIILDGTPFDLPRIMAAQHAPFYDKAFGSDPAYWRAASPAAQLSGPNPPTLLVCSSLRPQSCQRSRDYAQRLIEHGGQAQVLPVARNHGQINTEVGGDNEQTRAIIAFIDAQLRRQPARADTHGQ